MTNSEAHRQFYLNAAGISMWYAKRPLPGAAPSPEYHFPDEKESKSPGLHSEVVMPPAAQVKPEAKVVPRPSVDLQSLMAKPKESGEKAPVHESKTEAPSASRLSADVKVVADTVQLPADRDLASTPEKKLPISAHLGIWVSEQYVLISQWSEEASERLQEMLAQNLLGALNQSTLEGRQLLHWPVFRNPNVPGNSAQDFQELLRRSLSSHKERSLILLGVLADSQEAERNHCLQAALPLVGVDFQHSLAELSASPLHKRALWNALKSRYSL